MNQRTTQPIPVEAVALGLGFFLTVSRMIYEIALTLNPLGLSLRGLDPVQIQALTADCLTRPAFYAGVVFTTGACYPVLALIRWVAHAVSPKTGDLTRGSLAQGELDG